MCFKGLLFDFNTGAYPIEADDGAVQLDEQAHARSGMRRVG